MKKEDFTRLYLLCFAEDSLQDAERMWELSHSGKLISRKENGQHISMIILLPATLRSENDIELYYIFAACTHPDYRRRGIMEEMLKKAYSVALTDGRQGVFLRPASEALCRYYSDRGFTPFAHYATEKIEKEKTDKAFTALDFNTFCDLRAKYLKSPYIEWETPFLKTNFFYLSAFSDGENMLVCEIENNTLYVREQFGNAAELTSAVAHNFGCEKIFCRRYGNGAPYALARCATPLPETYVGLTIDVF